MTVIIHTTENLLDPAAITANPEASLAAYVAETTIEIQRAYPGTEVVHDPRNTSTYDHRVIDADDRYAADIIQCIIECVYETGNFWS